MRSSKHKSSHHKEGSSAKGKERAESSKSAKPTKPKTGAGITCGNNQPGCGVFNAENIHKQWPDLEHIPRPQPKNKNSHAYKVWKSEYKTWQNLKCGRGLGYFCREHGMWITCAEVEELRARNRDQDDSPPCPAAHYNRDAALATLTQTSNDPEQAEFQDDYGYAFEDEQDGNYQPVGDLNQIGALHDAEDETPRWPEEEAMTEEFAAGMELHDNSGDHGNHEYSSPEYPSPPPPYSAAGPSNLTGIWRRNDGKHG